MGRKKRFIKLTTEQEQELVHGFKTGKKATFRERCHYILLSNQGMEIESIAGLYGATRQRVARWFDRYQADGVAGLHSQRGQGRKPILRVENKVHVDAVKKLVEKHPQNLQPVLQGIKKRFGKSMSKKTLQRFLKKRSTGGNDSAKTQLENQILRNMSKDTNVC